MIHLAVMQNAGHASSGTKLSTNAKSLLKLEGHNPFHSMSCRLSMDRLSPDLRG